MGILDAIHANLVGTSIRGFVLVARSFLRVNEPVRMETLSEDFTIVIVDLKGDKPLLESCCRETARTGKMRLRWVSNEVGK